MKKKKNEIICLVTFFVSWVMVFKLPKIVHFLQNCADLSKKSKFIKATYLYPCERHHHALSEKSMYFRDLSNSSRDNEEWNIKKVLTQQKLNKIHQPEALISVGY